MRGCRICSSCRHAAVFRRTATNPPQPSSLCAAHLLQAGIDISIIALWLGHESIETTHIYIDADLATKERALEKLAPTDATSLRFKPTDSVLAFLQQL
jgi:integrase